jgi:hypothetical protein
LKFKYKGNNENLSNFLINKSMKFKYKENNKIHQKF